MSRRFIITIGVALGLLFALSGLAVAWSGEPTGTLAQDMPTDTPQPGMGADMMATPAVSADTTAAPPVATPVFPDAWNGLMALTPGAYSGGMGMGMGMGAGGVISGTGMGMGGAGMMSGGGMMMGAGMEGQGIASCPMQSTGSMGAGGMAGMGSMGSGSMADMGSMGAGNMAAMDGMYMSAGGSAIAADPSASLANPWWLLGWVLLATAVLAVLAALVLGIVALVRYLRPRPAG